MSDIHLRQTVTDRAPYAVTIDWLLTPIGALDASQELASAVTVALGTDRLANPDDELPGLNDNDRRGWWGDLDAETLHGGWPIGSRIWLLERAKITGQAARQGATLARAREYVREALQPFVDHQIASRVQVDAVRGSLERIDVTATLYRGPTPVLSLRYADLWGEIGA